MLKIDLHIHSINSGHGFGSIYEIAAEASRKEMEMIAITDHGPAMEGTTSAISLWMGNRAPDTLEGVRVLWGCEANIISPKGDLDISPELQERVEVLLVGLHAFSGYVDQGEEGNTRAFQEAMKNPNVQIVTHITHPQYPYDIEKVLVTALEHNVLPEINISYIKRKPAVLERDRRVIDITRQHGQKVIINSDAHFLHEIGDDSIIREYWDELGLSEEMIINNYPDELMERLLIDS